MHTKKSKSKKTWILIIASIIIIDIVLTVYFINRYGRIHDTGTQTVYESKTMTEISTFQLSNIPGGTNTENTSETEAASITEAATETEAEPITEAATETEAEPITEAPTETEAEPITEAVTEYVYTGEVYIPYPISGEHVNFENFLVPEYIWSLSSAQIPLGYGSNTARDEYNRPVYIKQLQEKYGDKYNSFFIGTDDRKVIYLAFRTGYEVYDENGKGNVEYIMDVLKKKDVKAVFFVLPAFARWAPSILKKVVKNGFTVGLHGYSHPSDGIANHSIAEQVEDANLVYQLIYEATGVEPYLYCFGSDIWNERALALMNELGFRCVFKSFSYTDYNKNNEPDPEESLKLLLNNLHSGEVIALHTTSKTTVKILADFIDGAREMGYEFEVIS